MHTHARPGSNDQGETLIELIIALAIIGIAVVAIVGGIATTILMSDIHRKQATAGAYVRNYAEAVEAYVAAGHFDPSASPDYSPSKVLTPPLDWGSFTSPNDELNSPLISVQCWTGTVFGACPGSSNLQQVKLIVASTDLRASEALTVIIRKPCDVVSPCT